MTAFKTFVIYGCVLCCVFSNAFGTVVRKKHYLYMFNNETDGAKVYLDTVMRYCPKETELQKHNYALLENLNVLIDSLKSKKIKGCPDIHFVSMEEYSEKMVKSIILKFNLSDCKLIKYYSVSRLTTTRNQTACYSEFDIKKIEYELKIAP